MTHILDLALRPDGHHADLFHAVERLNTERPNGHRVVFLVTVTHVDDPQRALLHLEPEATPADVGVLLDRFDAWAFDGQLRMTHLTRDQLTAAWQRAPR